MKRGNEQTLRFKHVLKSSRQRNQSSSGGSSLYRALGSRFTCPPVPPLLTPPPSLFPTMSVRSSQKAEARWSQTTKVPSPTHTMKWYHWQMCEQVIEHRFHKCNNFFFCRKYAVLGGCPCRPYLNPPLQSSKIDPTSTLSPVGLSSPICSATEKYSLFIE